MSSVIVSVILIVSVIIAVAVIVENKRNGKGSCSGGCGNCPMAGSCHNNKEK